MRASPQAGAQHRASPRSPAGALVAGLVVPHAPVLVEGVCEGRRAATEPMRRAARSLDLSDCDLVVVLSPHGETPGVYTKPEGDLRSFGVDLDLTCDGVPEAAAEIAGRWGRPLIDGAADHGALVPLALMGPHPPAVCCAVRDGDPSASADARALAAALMSMTAPAKWAFVASVNTSAGLSPRAPLTELSGARVAEEDFLTALGRDAGETAEAGRRLQERGGSCAAAPLAALARLFDGLPAKVHAYEAPFGVGYVVAEVRPRLG